MENNTKKTETTKKTRTSKSSNKVNLKSRDKLILLVIAFVLVVAIIVCIMVVGKDGGSAGTPGSAGEKGQEVTENVNDHLDGQIDYSKNDNVNIKDNVKENNSKALLKDKEFEGMKVKDIKLTASNGTTKFLATVENTSSKDFVNQKIVVVFKNKDGSEFARLDTYLGDIKVGEKAEIDATTTSDFSNAYDFVIEKGA